MDPNWSPNSATTTAATMSPKFRSLERRLSAWNRATQRACDTTAAAGPFSPGTSPQGLLRAPSWQLPRPDRASSTPIPPLHSTVSDPSLLEQALTRRALSAPRAQLAAWSAPTGAGAAAAAASGASSAEETATATTRAFAQAPSRLGDSSAAVNVSGADATTSAALSMRELHDELWRAAAEAHFPPPSAPRVSRLQTVQSLDPASLSSSSAAPHSGRSDNVRGRGSRTHVSRFSDSDIPEVSAPAKSDSPAAAAVGAHTAAADYSFAVSSPPPRNVFEWATQRRIAAHAARAHAARAAGKC
eukprot:TRINITY_DN36180_c0_g1_i1.p1 TRINITY_DN36180_c0_g1~~TRINITY_DN36180_c0_g1_i1.p1  ORF type:complete len:301 (+),score=-27.20 TRINITY_DN36180_c0_g1_i1:202-1104(+)